VNNSIEKLNKIGWADGEVYECSFSKNELCISYVDWQERKITLTFHDCISVEIFDVVGEALSHAIATDNDPSIQRSSEITCDDSAGLFCFAMWSAWEDRLLLRVVAYGVTISCIGGMEVLAFHATDD
jgi:hypothetical protein